MDDQIKLQTGEEYLVLLAMFRDLLTSIDWQTMSLDQLYDIIRKRLEFSFGYAHNPLGIGYEEAVETVKSKSIFNLSSFEQDRKNVLDAAMLNLIDFSVGANAQMYMDFENDEDEDVEDIFEQYHKRYAEVENSDIYFSAGVASSFLLMPDNATLTYMTQGDERVRDNHRALEGLTFTKAQFPEWLIPPIDWRCRCYLVQSYSPYTTVEDISWTKETSNPIFKESLAKCGRIFSDEHPYFIIDSKLKK